VKSTRKLILQKRKANPCATLEEIGSKVGVSKERVRQILNSENLPTKHWIQRYYICNRCGLIFFAGHGQSRLFCTPRCRILYYQAILSCDECGKLFTLRYSQVRERVMRGCQHFYCSRSCKGRAIGKKFGFSAHPENTFKNIRESKYLKFIPQINDMLQQGWRLTNIMVEMGIPEGSYLTIKRVVATNTKSRC
jgi:hypothetical protein